MKRTKRVVKAIAWVVGGALALVLVLAASAFGLLQTRWGADLVRRKAVEAANKTLQGQITVQQLDMHLGHIVVRGFSLADPEGAPVVRVDELEVKARLWPLVHKRLQVDLVAVRGPTLDVEQDARGTNLERALAPRDAKPAAPKKEQNQSGGGSSFTVDVAALEVARGRVSFRQPALRVALADLEARGRVHLQGAAVDAALRVQAALAAPTKGPVDLNVTASAQGDGSHVDLSFAAVDTKLRARADVQPRPGIPDVSLLLRELVVGPALLRAFAPNVPLGVPVRGEGTVDVRAGDITPALTFAAGSGRVEVRGTGSPQRLSARGLRVRARGMNVAQLVHDAPATQIDADVAVDGGVPNADAWDKFNGTATVDVRGRIAGQPLGPVTAEVRGAGAAGVSLRLAGVGPGVDVSASGTASRRSVALDARMTLSDLHKLAQTFAAPGTKLSGQADVQMHARGPLEAPVVSFVAKAPRLRVGGRPFQQLSMRGDLTAAGGLSADVKLGAPGPLTLTVRGQRDASMIRVDAFTLGYPGVTWALTAPARVVTAGERLELRTLRLRAGDQRIEADVSKRGDRIDGRVQIVALALDRLPTFLLDPALKLSGRVGADVRARGTIDRPTVDATLSVAEGRLRAVEGVNVNFAAHVSDGRRASGDLTATVASAGIDVKSRFDMPLAWPPPARAPLLLSLTTNRIDLPHAARAFAPAAAKDIKGDAQIDVKVGGHGAAPTVVVHAQGNNLGHRDRRFGGVTLDVSDTDRDPLSARIELNGLGRENHIRIKTPFELGSLLRLPPAALQDKLLSGKAPLDIDVLMDEMPAPLLASLAGQTLAAGTLSVRAHLQGAPLTLEGELTAQAKQISATNFPPTDGALSVQLGAKDISTSVDVRRRGRSLLSAKGRLQIPATARTSVPQLSRAPLSLQASFGPVGLQRVGLAPTDARLPARVLHGRMQAGITVSGSLRDPRVDASAKLERLRLEDQPLGQVDAAIHYAAGKPKIDVHLTCARGGDLRLSAQAEADLSWPAVTQPDRAWDKTPLSVQLDSKAFDLGWLSGFVPEVPVIEGRLDANVAVTGSAKDPRAKGRIEVRDSALTTVQSGRFDAVHVLVQGEGKSWTLQDLSARSDGGRAHVTGAFLPDGAGYKISARADAKDFSVRSEGQRVASVSLKANTEGRLEGTTLAFKPVRIDEVHINVPPDKRKSLQPLSRPGDIVLVKDGEPINRQQAQQLERLRVARGVVTGEIVPPPKSAMVIAAAVRAPRNLWVHAEDATVELGLSDNFRVEVKDKPLIYGEIRILRGTISVMGRRFDLEKDSLVRLGGGPETVALDVRAKHKADTPEGPLTVTVALSGTQDKPQISLTSEPALPESQLVTLLVTGRTSLDRSNGGSSTSADQQAVSILGGVLAQQLQKRLSKTLPLDVLSLQTGDGLTSAVLEAGTYLTSRLYVSYIGRVGADPQRYQNRNSVHLEYQLTSRWSFEGEYGDARTGSADVLWKRNY